MQEKQPVVYLLASKPYGTLYLGVTSDLKKRVWQHKNKLAEGFTEQYDVDQLVWYELHSAMAEAIAREKNLKNWPRDWKIKLIENENPYWQDLYQSLF